MHSFCPFILDKLCIPLLNVLEYTVADKSSSFWLVLYKSLKELGKNPKATCNYLIRNIYFCPKFIHITSHGIFTF